VHGCGPLEQRAAGAADLVEPAVFASSNGMLDILMIAKAKPVPSLAFTPSGGGAAINPTGWVYEICKRRASETSCPEGTGTVASQGDVLKVRLVNKLPIITAAKLKHVTEPGQANLFLNPTNLHSHGLLTPARAATLRDPMPQDTAMDSVVTLAGARFKVVACCPVPGGVLRSLPVFVSELVMMPSSRAEVWVTYRDQNGRVAMPPSTGATATLKQVGLTMGSGDMWPAVDLASVVFQSGSTRRLTSYALDIQGDAYNSMQPNGIFAAAVPDTDKASTLADCKPLAAGQRRRIFFGFSDVTVADTFALGYEEVDHNGAVVAGTQRPLTQFDPSQPTVCLPLGPGQTPVHETWELVQLSTESHNVHVHQSASVRSACRLPPTPCQLSGPVSSTAAALFWTTLHWASQSQARRSRTRSSMTRTASVRSINGVPAHASPRRSWSTFGSDSSASSSTTVISWSIRTVA
jgi:hypothetical protein